MNSTGNPSSKTPRPFESDVVFIDFYELRKACRKHKLSIAYTFGIFFFEGVGATITEFGTYGIRYL